MNLNFTKEHVYYPLIRLFIKVGPDKKDHHVFNVKNLKRAKHQSINQLIYQFYSKWLCVNTIVSPWNQRKPYPLSSVSWFPPFFCHSCCIHLHRTLWKMKGYMTIIEQQTSMHYYQCLSNTEHNMGILCKCYILNPVNSMGRNHRNIEKDMCPPIIRPIMGSSMLNYIWLLSWMQCIESKLWEKGPTLIYAYCGV